MVQLDKSTLVDEITALWKGSAARDPSRLEQLGPQLRQVCGISDRDTPRQITPKLRSAIEFLLDDQPELKVSFLARLGLHPEAQQKTPSMRLTWAAGQIGYSERTAGRRAETAREVFAHLAVSSSQRSSTATDPGFILNSFQGTLDLSGSLPRFVERREITVTVEELTAIPAAFSILEPAPGCSPSFDIQVTVGGIESYNIQRRARTITYLVRPRHRLTLGQPHVVEVEFALPDWHLLAPYYIMSPQTKVHSGEITVRFSPVFLPYRTWRVEGALRGEVGYCPPGGSEQPDPSGRISTPLQGTEIGRSYGIGWAWAPSLPTG